MILENPIECLEPANTAQVVPTHKYGLIIWVQVPPVFASVSTYTGVNAYTSTGDYSDIARSEECDKILYSSRL